MASDTSSFTGDGARLIVGSKLGPKLDLRSCIRVATWNVLTLSKAGYPEAMSHELTRSRISIAGLTEARIPGTRNVASISIQCTTRAVQAARRELPCSLITRSVNPLPNGHQSQTGSFMPGCIIDTAHHHHCGLCSDRARLCSR